VTPPISTDSGPPLVVVDSSVSLKWALDDEEAIEQAIHLRDDGLHGAIRMVAPDLWSYEVANGLWVAAKRSRLTFAQGARALAALHGLGVDLLPPEPSESYTFAQRYQIAIYDASYLALAARLNVELWTGDRKLYQAVAGEARWIRWIADYRSRR
jgi:predicted nucleic acid-binding protein